jgi:hypothetical protein
MVGGEYLGFFFGKFCGKTWSTSPLFNNEKIGKYPSTFQVLPTQPPQEIETCNIFSLSTKKKFE